MNKWSDCGPTWARTFTEHWTFTCKLSQNPQPHSNESQYGNYGWTAYQACNTRPIHILHIHCSFTPWMFLHSRWDRLTNAHGLCKDVVVCTSAIMQQQQNCLSSMHWLADCIPSPASEHWAGGTQTVASKCTMARFTVGEPTVIMCTPNH